MYYISSEWQICKDVGELLIEEGSNIFQRQVVSSALQKGREGAV